MSSVVVATVADRDVDESGGGSSSSSRHAPATATSPSLSDFVRSSSSSPTKTDKGRNGLLLKKISSRNKGTGSKGRRFAIDRRNFYVGMIASCCVVLLRLQLPYVIKDLGGTADVGAEADAPNFGMTPLIVTVNMTNGTISTSTPHPQSAHQSLSTSDMGSKSTESEPKTEKTKASTRPESVPSSSPTTTTTTMSINATKTKIVGFTDSNYKEIALRWYQNMIKMGYGSHPNNAVEVMVAVYDPESLAFFQRYNDNITTSMASSSSTVVSTTHSLVEHDTVYNRTLYGNHSIHRTCQGSGNTPKQGQLYRRSMFASRWVYTLRLLQQGYNVLVTDVDLIFVRYMDIETELHHSEYDIYHAFAGTIDSFPRNIYRSIGYTFCGCMTWLRSTPGVVRFVSDALVESCGCTGFDDGSGDPCSCHCDDQVKINTYSAKNYVWDYDGQDIIDGDRDEKEKTKKIAWTIEELNWDSMTGVDRVTNNRIKVWDRNTAYRGFIDGLPASTDPPCPLNMTKSWVAMPMSSDSKMYPKGQLPEIFVNKCVHNRTDVIRTTI